MPATLHGIEAFFPMQTRWITNWVLPFFGAMLPNRDKFLTDDEQIKMLDSALDTVPVEKKRTGADYIFVLLFEQRQQGGLWLAVAAGSIYGLTLSLVDRNPLHFVYGIFLLMMLTNANHAGIPFLGNHPRVSQNGKTVGIVFTPFWAVATFCNVLAFVYSLV